MTDSVATRAVIATNNAAYVRYEGAVDKVFVWDGDSRGMVRVYDPQTWEMVEAWQAPGAIRDRWEAREKIRVYIEQQGKRAG